MHMLKLEERKEIKMPKKKTKKTQKRSMRAIGGYSSLKYISLSIFGIGLLAFAAVAIWMVRSENVTLTPLPSITHTNEIPDTGEVVRLINNEREANGRAKLENNDTLKAVAERRLREMVNAQEYSHQNQDGKYYYDLLREHEYFSNYSCENLDIESIPTPAKFIKSWLTSSGGHRECLLNDQVSEIGIASGKFSQNDDDSEAFLVVVIFASSPQEEAEN